MMKNELDDFICEQQSDELIPEFDFSELSSEEEDLLWCYGEWQEVIN